MIKAAHTVKPCEIMWNPVKSKNLLFSSFLIWLVVWNMAFIFHNIWDNPSHWLSYFWRWLLHHQPVIFLLPLAFLGGRFDGSGQADVVHCPLAILAARSRVLKTPRAPWATGRQAGHASPSRRVLWYFMAFFEWIWMEKWHDLPSGKLSHNYGKSQFFMGESTISMPMFNSYVQNWGFNQMCSQPRGASARARSLVIVSRMVQTYYKLTGSTAQGGGGSFKNRKPIGEIGCCESRMAERIHWWTERCLRSPLFLSLSLTIYLPTSLSSMYLSIYRSIYLSLSLFHLITYLPIYLSTYLPIYLSTYVPIYLSIYLSVCLSIYLSLSLSLPLSLSHLSICLAVYLSVYLSICGAVSFSVM